MFDVAKDVPYFKDMQKKEKFLTVIGALVSHLISLKKASEILSISTDTLIEMLDSLNINFSYLEESDIDNERKR